MSTLRHVHHRYADQAGDPYHGGAGWLHCFLADVNHQPIAQDLSERAYARLTMLLDHCGIRLNSYAQYRHWGSLRHPGFALLSLFTQLDFLVLDFFTQSVDTRWQLWPGFVAGEWHNNHHLFPNGARAGFLGYQMDLPWLLIRSTSAASASTVTTKRRSFCATTVLISPPALAIRTSPRATGLTRG